LILFLFSITLSGGYEDDDDEGDQFIYTGSGGRDLKEGNKRQGPQVKDQELTKSNLAISLNCYGHKDSCDECTEEKICELCKMNWRLGKPVRVMRSWKCKNKFAPKEGFRYDGLYKVVDYWIERGQSGFKVIRYMFRRDDDEAASWSEEGKPIAKKFYEEGLKTQKKTGDKDKDSSEDDEKPKPKKRKKNEDTPKGAAKKKQKGNTSSQQSDGSQKSPTKSKAQSTLDSFTVKKSPTSKKQEEELLTNEEKKINWERHNQQEGLG